ncbi:MAG TPA: hypothetical protein VG347_11835 [Verrucomicrobiae bacterium]|nr:hypothetical protein [Verrucomicrobiae bacterium]
MTGDESSIKPAAEAIGFRYAYDPAVKEYAHPGGFIVLTPEGKVSHYFLGVAFSPKDLNDALRDADADKISSEAPKLDLLCFHYAPLTGKYVHLVMAVVRGGGLLTIAVLGWFIFVRKNHATPGRPK